MKTTTLTLRITPDLKDQLEKAADKDFRTMSSQAIFYIIQGVSHKSHLSLNRENMAVPNGVSEQTWADFKKLRAAKKAPVTERAIDGINKEAMKAGVTLETALQECCARGWTGFKAEWMQSNKDQMAAFLKPSVTTFIEMER
jgi:hypothetical protein